MTKIIINRNSAVCVCVKVHCVDGMHAFTSCVVKTINNIVKWFIFVVFLLSRAGVSFRPSFEPLFVLIFVYFRSLKRSIGANRSLSWFYSTN